MQARVKCPACQSTLAVNAAHGDSVLFRCPQCQHQFAIRLRSPVPDVPVRLPKNDPLPAPVPVMAPQPSYDLPIGRPPGGETPSSGSQLWIGICGVMALAVVCLMATMILLRAGGNDQNGTQNGVAGAAASASHSLSTAPPAGQSASSVAPSSPSASAAPVAAAPVLAYRFNRGEEHGYWVAIRAEVGGRVDEAGGMCSLRLNEEPSFARSEETLEGSVSLNFMAHLLSVAPARVVGNLRFPASPSTGTATGKLLVSEHGELVEARADMQLPYLLGTLATFAIEPLGNGDERTWQTEQDATLVVDEDTSGPLSMQIDRRPFEEAQSSFGRNRTKAIVIPAIEKSSYEVTGTNSDLATITKRYTFQTLDAPGSPPSVKVTGEGKLVFNHSKGYAEKMDYKATLVNNVRIMKITIPLTMQWYRLPAGELFQLWLKTNQKIQQQAESRPD